MPPQVPAFNDAAIASLVRDHWGIEGEIAPLVSYEDQNLRISTAGTSYVLKIANQKWSLEYLQMQSDVLEYLKASVPDLTFPRVVKTLKGKTIATADGFAMRILTYLEGKLLANTPRTPELYRDMGRFLGQFSRAMQSYPLAVADGSDELWRLDNVMACKVYLSEITDDDARDRIARLYSVYEKDILPVVPRLRKAVIHSDANEQNFLVDPDRPRKIAGLIDFGDVQLASQINDLAIALAYGLLEEDDIGMASQQIIEGYQQAFELEEKEHEIVYCLMAMRLVASITMSSHSAILYPDNEYIVISQKPAIELLKRLEDEGYILT